MLSKSCKYALRSLIYIAVNGSVKKNINIREISKTLDIPEHYLGKILQSLTKQKILKSTKGPNGGFYLTEKELNLPLINIVEVVDGLDFFNNCFFGLSSCSDENPCTLHTEVKSLKQNFEKILKKKTIATFANDIKNNNYSL